MGGPHGRVQRVSEYVPTAERGEGDNALVTIDGAPLFWCRVDLADRWNGWLVPGFRQQVAAEVVAWIEATQGGDPDQDQLAWADDDRTVVHHQPQYGHSDLVEPDASGRWYIGAAQWTWCQPDPAQLRVPTTAAVGDYVAELAEWVAYADAAGLAPDETGHSYDHVDADADPAVTAGAVVYEHLGAYLVQRVGDHLVAVPAAPAVAREGDDQEAWIARTVATAPPLTADQVERLRRGLLHPR